MRCYSTKSETFVLNYSTDECWWSEQGLNKVIALFASTFDIPVDRVSESAYRIITDVAAYGLSYINQDEVDALSNAWSETWGEFCILFELGQYIHWATFEASVSAAKRSSFVGCNVNIGKAFSVKVRRVEQKDHH